MKLYMAVVLVLIILILFGLRALRRKTTAMLEQVLYVKQAPQLYLELLQNPRFKLLYRKSTIYLFQLDAYLILDDLHEIEERINLINTLPLTKPEKLDFLMKKLSYSCMKQDQQASKQTLEEWKQLLSSQKNEHAQRLLMEGETIYRLYIEHDQSLVSLFHQELQTSEGYRKGLVYYRLAKLAYYRNDNTAMNIYLKQAQSLLKGSTWQETVQEAQHNPSILETR